MKEKKVSIDYQVANLNEDIKSASYAELIDWKDNLEEIVTICKKHISDIDAKVSSIFNEKAQAAYISNNKSSGKLTIDTIDTALTKIKVTADISKTVSWDSKILRSLYVALPSGFSKTSMDVKFNISEANYPKIKEDLVAQEKSLGLAENSLTKLLETSRTVKYGTPKITLEKISA